MALFFYHPNAVLLSFKFQISYFTSSYVFTLTFNSDYHAAPTSILIDLPPAYDFPHLALVYCLLLSQFLAQLGNRKDNDWHWSTRELYNLLIKNENKVNYLICGTLVLLVFRYAHWRYLYQVTFRWRWGRIGFSLVILNLKHKEQRLCLGMIVSYCSPVINNSKNKLSWN